MKVSLANGTALKAVEFFSRTSAHTFLTVLRGPADHNTFARFTQLRGQSWSVVEYLAGYQAPADRLGRFRSFLSELKWNSSQEEVFARHFGHGFDALLEEWRGWVLQQSLGDDPIPPPEIRAAILERLVPAIRDRSKKSQDRIQAMRAMAGAGYALGADTLIDVLRDGDERFAATATWALESISGLTLGSDANRWAEWWAARDTQPQRPCEIAEHT